MARGAGGGWFPTRRGGSDRSRSKAWAVGVQWDDKPRGHVYMALRAMEFSGQLMRKTRRRPGVRRDHEQNTPS